ncbi:SUPPRESSOR OF ABI3-5 [Camellia lanceoleosa]|uniref:SUPPRESSOR OF ABI3-5 n=1 Tax=Camellia lanceoleosa TaxID=1840588 RepID=A0ACC0J3F0_9ERIC|nr:SUPPRESSOR OF ABI3-5 [Camellia lanceoleosa]
MDVDPNRNYSIWLHFAEIDISVTGIGQRVFDILINGDIAFQDIDIVNMSRDLYRALVLNKTVAVNGRTLTITFHPTKGHALINAIEILELVHLFLNKPIRTSASDNHFSKVEDATKALGATNGATIEKNRQILQVAYAKSILGPGSAPSGSSQSSSLAAAAIEATAFAQQYDAVGWAPKKYNPDNKQPSGGQEPSGGEVAGPKDAYSLQSSFVWDEASGYYYDASSGFYYDGNTGLYYDGYNGVWYSYDHQTQQ